MLHNLTLAMLGVTFPVALASCATAASPADVDVPSPAATATTFRATGNEPSWRLDIVNNEMTLLTNFGQDRLAVATPAPQVSGATTRYVARTNGREFTTTIVDQLCVDTMSGMPHPQSVTVVVGDQTLTGCGGEPASLLQGAEWTVESIDDEVLVPGSQVTLAFAQDGRLAGHASCNRFMSTYVLTGEGLAIAQGAGTRMMCDEALMHQELAFLATLGKVRSFSIDADGALLLRTGDGGAIRARRR